MGSCDDTGKNLADFVHSSAVNARQQLRLADDIGQRSRLVNQERRKGGSYAESFDRELERTYLLPFRLLGI